MSSRAVIVALAGAVALSAGPTAAFEETRGGGAPAVQAPAQGAGDISPPWLDLRGTGTSIAPSPAPGLELRIPGLGKLGVLPKLDFGLELLYGASEGSTAENRLRPEDNTDELRIRGSLKHRF